MAPALELHHIWKKFRRGEFNDCLRDAIPALVKGMFGFVPKRDQLADKDFWALSDIDFKVEPGETLGIIGHNGAGKSTLLKILSNIVAPNRGFMRVNGRLRSLIEIGAGFHGDLTGRENIYLNGAILGMTHREIQKNFDSIVDFSGVEDFLDTPVKRYSSGMAARLGFAVAAHLEPEILIVDEVLSVGDAEFQKKCLGKMNDVASDGRTVLFVSHNMAAVQNLCKRAILLQKGKIIFDGTTQDTVEYYYKLLREDQNQLSRQFRNPNQKAYITKILIGHSPEDLVEGGFCECNNDLYVRIFYEVNEPFEVGYINIVFLNSMENHVLGLTTLLTDQQPGRIEKSGYIDFHVKNCPLRAGSYSSGAAIFERNSKTCQNVRLDHFVPELPLQVAFVDNVGWKFSRGYDPQIFVPYVWEMGK